MRLGEESLEPAGRGVAMGSVAFPTRLLQTHRKLRATSVLLFQASYRSFAGTRAMWKWSGTTCQRKIVSTKNSFVDKMLSTSANSGVLDSFKRWSNRRGVGPRLALTEC